jgi:hypothetical protein
MLPLYRALRETRETATRAGTRTFIAAEGVCAAESRHQKATLGEPGPPGE